MSKVEFLTFLVDETLKLQKTGESNLSSMELKLRDYDLLFLRGEFIPQFQVIRFSTSFGVLDIPINWSVFSVDTLSFQILNEKNDPDCLFKVLQNEWNKRIKQIVISHADGFCYLIGLREGEDCFLHDLLNRRDNLNAA
jgi:hypothetical protein